MGFRGNKRTNGALAGGVDLARQVQRVGGRQVSIGGRDRQDDGVVTLAATSEPDRACPCAQDACMACEAALLAAEGPAECMNKHLDV